MPNPGWIGRHFCGVYGMDSERDGVAQKFTPVRESIEQVVADLTDAQRQASGLRAAQIIDLERLEPIEPISATMARLESAAAA
jgi:hypothetical protein